MQDKQIIPLFEKFAKLSDPKQVTQTSEQILARLKPEDTAFILEKIMSCLQSTDYNVTTNYALLLNQLINKFGTQNKLLQSNQILEKLNSYLSKKHAYGKSEYKHFILTKYMIYTFVNAPLTSILEDRKTEDSEYLTYILLTQIKSENVKKVSNAIKNDLQQMTPRLFCILVKLQQSSSQFQWEKLLHEQIFDRTKFLKLLEQATEAFPKKQLFYQYVAIYMAQFVKQQDSVEIFNSFWEFLQSLEELKKSHYAILQIFKYMIKSTEIPLSYFQNEKLIVQLYRQFGNSNSTMKRLANNIEKALSKRTLTFDFLIYIRSIYGYRLHPKNLLASVAFSQFTEEELSKYFEQMQTLQKQQTDPVQKLYYINEIYVLASVGKVSLQQLGNIMKYIYDVGCSNFDQIFEELDEETKQAYQQDEIKKKSLEQSQSFFYSLAGKIASEQQQFNELTKILLKLFKTKELIAYYKQITSGKPSESLKHLANSIIVFSFINQEEGQQILEEFKHLTVDLSEAEPKLKKKVKANPEKAKVVLIEIFVQLLTKSPQYLRDAVNQCCKQMEFTPECLEILLDVLIKEDHEYIAEMQQQEMAEEEGAEESIDEEEEDNQ